jgi:hypothetical protein
MEMRVGTTGREAVLPTSRGTYLATVSAASRQGRVSGQHTYQAIR